WQVSGAKGPYRVTPNQMVVIPTKKHVSLHYGNTPVDMLGWFVTLLGVGGLIVLWRAQPVVYPPKPPLRRRGQAAGAGPAGDGDGTDGAEPTYSDALGRQLAGVNGGQPVDVDSYWD